MGEQTALGYLILAARSAHLTVTQEEKLVESMRKVMADMTHMDALNTYIEWTGYDVEQSLIDAREEYKAELQEAARKVVA